MNNIIACIVGALFLLMFLCRRLYMQFYPEKFSERASKVLFIGAWEKALFPPEDKKLILDKTTGNETSSRTGLELIHPGSECPKLLLNIQ